MTRSRSDILRIRTPRFRVTVADPASVLATQATYAQVFNTHVDYIVLKDALSPKQLHDALYARCRQQHPSFPSAMLQAARDCALEAVKACRTKAQKKLRRQKKQVPASLKPLLDTAKIKLPRKRPESAMRLDTRTVALRGRQLTFSTVGKRQRVILQVPARYVKYFDGTWSCNAATIRCDDSGILHLNLQVKAPKLPLPTEPRTVGLDLNVVNHAALSDGLVFYLAHFRRMQRQFLYTRGRLQKKGTSSARRKLKSIGHREQRFIRDACHCLTKLLVQLPYDTFVIEDLTGIREDKTKAAAYQVGRKRGNKRLHSWPFAMLAMFLAYKAEDVGKQVVRVSPAWTSQTCSGCGKLGDRDGSRFHCPHCGLRLHADYNAARNIEAKHLKQKQQQKNLRPAEVTDTSRPGRQAALSPGRTLRRGRCAGCVETLARQKVSGKILRFA